MQKLFYVALIISLMGIIGCEKTPEVATQTVKIEAPVVMPNASEPINVATGTSQAIASNAIQQ